VYTSLKRFPIRLKPRQVENISNAFMACGAAEDSNSSPSTGRIRESCAPN